MKAVLVTLLLFALVSADDTFSVNQVKKDPLYTNYEKSIRAIENDGKKRLDAFKKRKAHRLALEKKIQEKLAAKARKNAAKKAYYAKKRKMYDAKRRSLKTIKQETNVKNIRKGLFTLLKTIAGKDKKLVKLASRLRKEFDAEAKEKVKRIVRKLRKILKNKYLEHNEKRGSSAKRLLTHKAIDYIHKSNDLMHDSEKYLKISCKISPAYCGFFKKAFVVAHPIHV
ncbi:Axoneme-associated protein mst101 [Entamoeba marina]